MDRHDYSYFLNGFDPGSDGLAKMALKDVSEKSRLSAETLEQAQVRLFGREGRPSERASWLRFIRRTRHTQDGQACRDTRLRSGRELSSSWSFRLYPALDGRRYLHAKGEPARPYILPETWRVREKPNKPTWITEGAKKALKLAQHGRYAVSLAGVWNFREGKTGGDETFLFDDLEQFTWRGRTVVPGLRYGPLE